MSLKYRCCLFDFDGTVADTGEGIRKSVAYSLERMDKPALPEATLSRFIGPPLHDSYKEFCGMSDEEADRAIACYRERYVDVGLYESYLYPGIAALLRRLHDAGAYVGIASSKPQFLLERLAAYYKIDPWLDTIAGVGLARHAADKRDLLLRAMPKDIDPKQVCMVGDRRFDIEAACALGIGALGANYGYALPGELAQAGAEAVFDSVEALSAYLL
ncbi:MAG: HAD hydrolase-like protein [Firmicutes bacterium]|nr:HAD hydrolase-like protein [Bacillota bacterium]